LTFGHIKTITWKVIIPNMKRWSKAFVAMLSIAIWVLSPCSCTLAAKSSSPNNNESCSHCRSTSQSSPISSENNNSPNDNPSNCCSACNNAKNVVNSSEEVLVSFNYNLSWSIVSSVDVYQTLSPLVRELYKDRGPPEIKIILLSLRASHQENAPPFAV
jgi:hypothetical protein